MKKMFIVALISLFMFAACSVYMAAKKQGVRFEELSQCKTKGCLQAKGAIPIGSKKNKDGVLVETYKVQKPTGSTARAVMHGVLDIATLGIWEIAGTPIEGAKGKKGYISIKVYFENDDDTIQKVELAQ